MRSHRSPRAGLFIATAVLLWGACTTPAPTEPVDDPDPPVPAAPSASIETSTDVSVGLATTLDGSTSTDPAAGSLIFAWSLTAPSGSAAALSDASADMPTFTPDVAGSYTVSLTVTNGGGGTDTESVTVTAADRTAVVTIDATGGLITATDGDIILEIAPNTVSAATELSMTPVSSSQAPVSLRGLPAGARLYDIQPSGIEAVVRVDFADAYTDEPGAPVSLRIGRVLDGTDGVLTPLLGSWIAPDPNEPTTAVHTSDAVPLEHLVVYGYDDPRFRTLSASADVPTTVDIGTSLEADMTFSYDRLGLTADERTQLPSYEIRRVYGTDALQRPVIPDGPGGSYDFTEGSDGAFTASASYECEDGGEGEWGTVLTVEEVRVGLEGTYTYNLRLPRAVRCNEPIVFTTHDVPTASRIFTSDVDDEIVLAGWPPRRFDLLTSGTSDFATPVSLGSSSQWAERLGDGFFFHEQLGTSYSWNAATGQTLLARSDFTRQLVLGADGILYGASAFGHPRLVNSDFSLEYFEDYDNVQAVAGGFADREAMLVTVGDGNAAFSVSNLWVADWDADEDPVEVSGDAVFGTILNQWQRVEQDFSCTPLPDDPTTALCAYSAGEREPGTLVMGQSEDDRHGLGTAFFLNAATATATRIEQTEEPTVGATTAVYGSFAIAAMANQIDHSVKIWKANALGVVASHEIDVSSACTEILDLALTLDAGTVVVSCIGADGFGGEEDRLAWFDIPGS